VVGGIHLIFTGGVEKGRDTNIRCDRLEQNDQCVTSQYRESDQRSDRSYAFQSFSRYFDVIHWSFYTAPCRTHLWSLLPNTKPHNLVQCHELQGMLGRWRTQCSKTLKTNRKELYISNDNEKIMKAIRAEQMCFSLNS